MKKPGASNEPSAAERISRRIAELGDWRGETLARMRRLIREADPQVVEEWKWMGTPVWSHDGILCTGESYRKVVKLTFARGASLADPAGLFNASLDGKVRRAIDIPEGVQVDAAAFKALVRAAVALNRAGKAKRAKDATKAKPRAARPADARQAASAAPASAAASKRPATIAEYIRAAPVAGQPHLRQLHALLKRAAPRADEAIKWGMPFFVEPRFVFAFSAHKAHLDFAPGAAAMAAFRAELAQHRTTKGMLQLPYDRPLPLALLRRMAAFCVRTVRERGDDNFW